MNLQLPHLLGRPGPLAVAILALLAASCARPPAEGASTPNSITTTSTPEEHSEASPPDLAAPEAPAASEAGGPKPVEANADEEAQTTARPAYKDLSVVEANNAFGLDLYRRLTVEQKGNVALAPVSVSVALAMTAAGASGETKREMDQVLRFSDLKEPSQLHQEFGKLLESWKSLNSHGNQWSVANRLYGQKNFAFEAPFLNLLAKNYDASLVPIDFAQSEGARKQINLWVKGQTQSRIPELLPTGSLTNLTRLVLVNAVYLQAQWDESFDKAKTKSERFEVTASEAVTVPMMHASRSLVYYEDPRVKVVTLPYKGQKMSMMVVVPQQRHGLAAVEETLRLEDLQAWRDRGRMESKVNLALPRFETRSQLDLPAALRGLGMERAFDDRAEFHGMSKKEDLYLSRVVHEAVVTVDEKGTVAAAATAVVAVTKSARPRVVELIADQPFLFLIVDNTTGSLLFLGRVTRPALGS